MGSRKALSERDIIALEAEERENALREADTRGGAKEAGNNELRQQDENNDPYSDPELERMLREEQLLDAEIAALEPDPEDRLMDEMEAENEMNMAEMEDSFYMMDELENEEAVENMLNERRLREEEHHSSDEDSDSDENPFAESGSESDLSEDSMFNRGL